jgi:hypothetical protein
MPLPYLLPRRARVVYSVRKRYGVGEEKIERQGTWLSLRPSGSGQRQRQRKACMFSFHFGNTNILAALR